MPRLSLTFSHRRPSSTMLQVFGSFLFDRLGEEFFRSLNPNPQTGLERRPQTKNRPIPGEEDGPSLEHVGVQVVPIPPVRQLRIAFFPRRFEFVLEGHELVRTELISPQ